MRADRLLTLMMLLQTRGRMTASALAAELEVSERTVYRDIDALSAAGVPVYADRGRGGGCNLMDDYRTHLTGMTESELQALFLLSIPAALADLGVDADLRGALLKLQASIPQMHTQAAQSMHNRIHLDWSTWHTDPTPVPHLTTLYDALQSALRLSITHSTINNRTITSDVAPYGLVSKAGVWYLVFERYDHINAIRVSRLQSMQLTDDAFTRPLDFDLAAFWTDRCAMVEGNRVRFIVTVRVAPELTQRLRWHFGHAIDDALQSSNPDENGWYTLDLPFDSFESARERILGYGRAAEVLAPIALRHSVRDFAQQIVMFYSEQSMSDR